MKTILVPVDFSKPSENALKVASKLAIKNNSRILVLHVVELAESLFGSEQFNVDNQEVMFFLQMAKKRFEKFLNKPYLNDVDIDKRVEIGPTSFMINKTVKENHVDLIVMGSVGASGLKEVLIGSNTEKIVRKSDVPVLVVKNEMKDFSIKNIVFASNFELENLEPFKKAKEFANQFEAEIKLLYVNLPGNQFYSTEEIREQMRVFLNKAEVPFTDKDVMIYNDYTIELGVINGAKSAKAELIVMPTHGRRGISHFFNGSIGEDVVNHSTLPVLTFKIENK